MIRMKKDDEHYIGTKYIGESGEHNLFEIICTSGVYKGQYGIHGGIIDVENLAYQINVGYWNEVEDDSITDN